MGKAKEIFRELTFSKRVMKDKLGKEIYEKLLASIENEEALDQTIAGDVAHAMKEWAIEQGATHFTHWFQPHRGGTAEKHDAFICYDENWEIIERFSANQLIQSEPDASSFPSGGIRSTFEARGYTAWDPTSPAFLIKAKESCTLVIPSVYLSWDGLVLDIKTPMLRSQKALNHAVMKMQRLLGNRLAKRIKIYLGPEQEYFLISKEPYKTRPDLRILGRTVFGATPIKGQQMEDHYFGAIKGRVLTFMEEVDRELYRRGIPAKTRHNEVAPNQFELAPLYEEANLSVDHNLQMMDIMRSVADRNDLVVLFSEKPFAGVNGSGKHMNWSLGDNTGANYLEPSKSPLKNISFLITIGAILKGMESFGGLLRAAIADADNDFRLGANEAPPAIMSVYLGSYLSGLLDEVEGLGKVTEQVFNEINLGIQNLPKIAQDISDRNRTSPLAFTGNKFEFRAVGSSQNCSHALTVFNLMVSWGFDLIYDRLSQMKGDAKKNALLVLKDIFTETKHIRFEGNNYSEEWQIEAAQRGLPNCPNTPSALEHFLKEESIELFKKYEVLSEIELHSKIEIRLETYNKIKLIEFKTATDIVRTMILPALTKHIGQMASAYAPMVQSGLNAPALKEQLDSANQLFEKIVHSLNIFESQIEEGEKIENIHHLAYYNAEKLIPLLNELRFYVDGAESIIPHEFWPMAKYQELLASI